MVNGVPTTSFELVYGIKPDYWVLLHLFSTGFFKHDRDGSRDRDGVESRTLQGIVIGHCRQSDGLLFYSPHTKQVYRSSSYKLDEGRSTPNTFNLQYDGGIFVGLYGHGNTSFGTEPFPEGTGVQWPTKIDHKTIYLQGMVVLVPLPQTSSQLPTSSETEPPYVVQLVDVIHIPPTITDDIVDCHLHLLTPSSLPTWLGCMKKVMFLQASEYVKGYMQFDASRMMWHFSQQ